MDSQQRTLAWHETLELHELIAFQSNGLVQLKMSIRRVQDPALRALYAQAIRAMEANIRELVQFLRLAPREEERQQDPETGFYAGSLLGLAKTLVRNYAIAITETATPMLREVLVRQLMGAIELHAQVFQFMYERSYYPSYDLERLLANDVRLAQNALRLPYEG